MTISSLTILWPDSDLIEGVKKVCSALHHEFSIIKKGNDAEKLHFHEPVIPCDTL